MKFESFLIKDTSGNKSLTATSFLVGFLVANVKLLLGGVTVAGFTMSPFSGVEYAAVVGSLGTIYSMRRNNSESNK
ncbi:MAG: hypothetical protein R3213_05940 [Flavobacteriaceae bacterium]|nr:hypothetical protein [Flavobacteriaceae bacterium]